MVGPSHIGHRGFRLRAGGVDHQHVDGAEAVGDRGYQLGDLLFVGDVGAEGVADTAVVTDGAGNLECVCVVAEAVNRHGEAVAGQPSCDSGAKAA